jgi:hypothetical protein
MKLTQLCTKRAQALDTKVNRLLILRLFHRQAAIAVQKGGRNGRL